MTTHGIIYVENDKEFRRTFASIAMVIEAIDRLVREVGEDSPAVKNARKVVKLLGHTLPGGSLAMKLTAFERAYLECALWSSTDESTPEGGEPLDKNYDIDDFEPTCFAQMVLDCEAFQAQAKDDLEGLDEEQAGHDFWLTRNGHGAGFWDRGLGERGERLSAAAKAFGEVWLYVGDDGKVYVS